MLKNMKIGTRLMLGFGIVLALLFTIAGSGYWGVHSVEDKTITMLQSEAQIARAFGKGTCKYPWAAQIREGYVY